MVPSGFVANFPFLGSVVEQAFYKRHRAEILGGRLFEGGL
jgi:hypothetical protein